jgi:hypothetical protein
MTVIIKCDPPSILPTGMVSVGVPVFGNVRPQLNEVAFIWTSELRGGRGLQWRGVVEGARVARGAAELTIRILDREPVCPLTNEMLAPHRDSLEATPLASLTRKLYRHALNKVAALDEAEARYLDGFFPGRGA